MNAEQIASFAVMSIFAVPAIFFGIYLCCGKRADMIAGFNTASPEERAKWDEDIDSVRSDLYQQETAFQKEVSP